MAIMDKRFKNFMINNIKNSYKKFLSEKIYNDKSMVDSMFSVKEIDESFDKIVFNTFNGQKVNFQKYESLTGDKYLMAYLKIFTYYVRECYERDFVVNGKYCIGREFVDEKGNKFKSSEAKFLQRLENVIFKNFNIMYADIMQNNLWWECDSPTTLRKAIIASGIILPIHKLQRLAKKYLNRTIDIDKELKTKSDMPVKLINELDENLKNMGHDSVYAWYEGKIGQGRRLHTSKTKPNDGRYYFVMYENDKFFIENQIDIEKDLPLIR